jgi:hypothetical protein
MESALRGQVMFTKGVAPKLLPDPNSHRLMTILSGGTLILTA